MAEEEGVNSQGKNAISANHDPARDCRKERYDFLPQPLTPPGLRSVAKRPEGVEVKSSGDRDMAVNIAPKPDRRQSGDTVTYPGAPEPLKVPRTPLETRQGYHPKKVSSPTPHTLPREAAIL